MSGLLSPATEFLKLAMRIVGHICNELDMSDLWALQMGAAGQVEAKACMIVVLNSDRGKLTRRTRDEGRALLVEMLTTELRVSLS